MKGFDRNFLPLHSEYFFLSYLQKGLLSQIFKLANLSMATVLQSNANVKVLCQYNHKVELSHSLYFEKVFQKNTDLGLNLGLCFSGLH